MQRHALRNVQAEQASHAQRPSRADQPRTTGSLREQPVEHGLPAWDKEVFGLVTEGLTNWEIAERLGVSVKQARADVLRVVGKLGPVGRQVLGVTRVTNR